MTKTGSLPTLARFFTFDNGTITDYDTDGGLDVIIPAEINGVAVTAIGEGAFQNKGLTSIFIVSGITTIENYAVADNDLTSVSIPNTVYIPYIGYNATHNTKASADAYALDGLYGVTIKELV